MVYLKNASREFQLQKYVMVWITIAMGLWMKVLIYLATLIIVVPVARHVQSITLQKIHAQAVSAQALVM